MVLDFEISTFLKTLLSHIIQQETKSDCFHHNEIQNELPLIFFIDIIKVLINNLILISFIILSIYRVCLYELLILNKLFILNESLIIIMNKVYDFLNESNYSLLLVIFVDIKFIILPSQEFRPKNHLL